MREYTGIDPHKLTVNPTIGNGGGVPFANASGAIIPPFACMEVVGNSGGLIANVRKPTSAGINPAGLLFNGSKAIPVGGQGLAQSGETTISMIKPTVDMTAGYEVSLGSVSGQWYLDSGQSGYRASTYQSGTALGRCAVVRPFRVAEVESDAVTFTTLSVSASPAETSWYDLGTSISYGNYRVRDLTAYFNTFSFSALTYNNGTASASVDAQSILYVSMKFTNTSLVATNESLINLSPIEVYASDYTANKFSITSRYSINGYISTALADTRWQTLPITHVQLSASVQRTSSPAPVGYLQYTISSPGSRTLGFTRL